MRNKRLISLILALVLIFSFSISSFGAVQDVAIPDLKSGWGASGASTTVTYPSGYVSSWFYYVLRFIQNIGLPGDVSSTSSLIGLLKGLNNSLAGSSTAGSSTNNVLSKVSTISDKIVTIQSDISAYVKPYLQTISNKITLIDSDVGYIKTNSDTVVDKLGNSFTSGSVLYFLSNILSVDNGIHSDTSSMLPLLQRIRDMVGDDDDYRRKQESENNNQSFEDNFLSGDNSVSTSDISALSGLGTSFKDFFSMTGAGGGSAEVDISAWTEILVDDEPFTFFTEADSIAESMGVEAGGYISNPGDTPGGGGDTPDIPDTPPDGDEFPNDGNVYVRCIGLENAYGSYPAINGVQLTDEFTVLSPGDIIELSLGVHKSIGYFCSINGVYFGYEDLNLGLLEPYFTNNITLEFFKVPFSSGVKSQYIYLTYRPSLSSLQAPMRMMMSFDTSNRVVTHYYDDNMNKLFGFLRGD